MLFLYRPRQSWMPYGLPRAPTDNDAYRRRLQTSFEATRRVAPPRPAPDATAPSSSTDPVARLKELAELHATGMLSDSEFATAKAKVLGPTEDS